MTAQSTQTLDPHARRAGYRDIVLFGALWRVIADCLRRRRNAAAADRLNELPAHLLADIGIERGAVEEIRRHGFPSMRWSVHGYRPLRSTTGVDIGGRRP